MQYKDGKLFWWISPGRRAKVGSEVGTLDTDGYRRVGFRGTTYLTHRLIFLYHHGYLPENQIDHINRIKNDNRIENLREVSPSCNLRNTGTRTDNTSGIKGVFYHNPAKKWQATVYVNSENKYLGLFETKVEAACHRLAAEQCLNWSDCDSESSAYKYVKQIWKSISTKKSRSTSRD